MNDSAQDVMNRLIVEAAAQFDVEMPVLKQADAGIQPEGNHLTNRNVGGSRYDDGGARPDPPWELTARCLFPHYSVPAGLLFRYRHCALGPWSSTSSA